MAKYSCKIAKVLNSCTTLNQTFCSNCCMYCSKNTFCNRICPIADDLLVSGRYTCHHLKVERKVKPWRKTTSKTEP